MSDHTRVNLRRDVEDMAPGHGLGAGLESRFARKPLELEKSGLSFFHVAPRFRVPFGHRHSEQEEVYVVVSGSLRMRVEDDFVELEKWDALRVAPGRWRAMEGGPDGADVIAFGAPNTQNRDTEMQPGWWADEPA